MQRLGIHRVARRLSAQHGNHFFRGFPLQLQQRFFRVEARVRRDDHVGSAEQRVIDQTSGITELLTPFFLVGVGLYFDVSAFSTSSVVWLALTILVAAILSKLAACGLGAIRLGRADALRVGVGMAPRGEVGMVVAQIGLSMGVMSNTVYGVVVFMSVATTLVAPPLLNWAYRDVSGAPKREEMPRLG